MNLVPFSQFASDLATGHLPDFSFILPNVKNDAHDGSLSQADRWLQSNIGPLISHPIFQQDGLLVSVFDESDQSDSTDVAEFT
jgi:phosphatidylinositol-3-phosphatase